MATPSYIGIKKPDGTARFIYCHYDGTPSYTGNILLKHYPHADGFDHILALGGLEQLKPTLEDTLSYNKDTQFAENPDNIFEMPVDQIAEMAGVKHNVVQHIYLYDEMVNHWWWCILNPAGGLSYRKLDTVVNNV